jgi:hypothetical protein
MVITDTTVSVTEKLEPTIGGQEISFNRRYLCKQSTKQHRQPG